jgi:adenylate cyclase
LFSRAAGGLINRTEAVMEQKKAKSQPFGEHFKPRGIREILLKGVFWRILVIEIILLIGSVFYRMVSQDVAPMELLWYALRIMALVAIILSFMMITLRRFLESKIIKPLETIADANLHFDGQNPEANPVPLDGHAAREVRKIVETRTRMLQTILKVSDQRLQLVNFIKDTFGRYLSRRIVDEILDSPGGRKIGGRRQTVSVVMSDLRGFSDLSDSRDPEAMVQILNRYLETMTQIIHRYDGIIDEFIGDAILTVFGVPEPRKDDAARAVACALDMQRSLAALNLESTGEGMPHLEMGIGINTGPVVVGNIGSEARTKYGIVGAVVNVASRIESNTIGGQVLIGESTYEQVRDKVTAQPPMTIMMKGLKKPLVCYPVTAIGAPYDVAFTIDQRGRQMDIRLPIRLWRMAGKQVVSDPVDGETRFLGGGRLAVQIPVHLEPLTDVKLLFEFCREAHCFSDIYAKVLSAENGATGFLHHLGITYMDERDKTLLGGWMEMTVPGSDAFSNEIGSASEMKEQAAARG